MATIGVERVGESVTIDQDGVVIMMMPCEVAAQLGLALVQTVLRGEDSLDAI
jgi:hypothetical protein